jgi:hypothetical protein
MGRSEGPDKAFGAEYPPVSSGVAVTGEDGAEVPLASVAVTLKLYSVPATSPVTEQLVDDVQPLVSTVVTVLSTVTDGGVTLTA